MKYILAVTEKDGKKARHIVRKSVDYFMLKNNAKHIDHKKYIVEIYKGNWKLVGKF